MKHKSWELIAQAITVKDIMTPRSEWKEWEPSISRDELLQEAKELSIDVLPITDKTNDKVVGVLYGGHEIYSLTDWLVSCDDTIQTLIQFFAIRKKSDLLVFSEHDQDVIGIVGLADLNKPLARTYIYNLLSELEMMFAHKVRQYFQGNEIAFLDLLKESLSDTELELEIKVGAIERLDMIQLRNLCGELSGNLYKARKYQEIKAEWSVMI